MKVSVLVKSGQGRASVMSRLTRFLSVTVLLATLALVAAEPRQAAAQYVDCPAPYEGLQCTVVSAVEDAYTSSAHPNTNYDTTALYGDAGTATLEPGPRRWGGRPYPLLYGEISTDLLETYLAFNVPDVELDAVNMCVHVFNSTIGGYTIDWLDNEFAEATLTYNTRPASTYIDAEVGSGTSLNNGWECLELAIGAELENYANTTVYFRFTADSWNGLGFDSSETDQAPYLLLIED
jgi:hypothetical protein